MSLWHELKRRNVVRVAIAYVAAAWLILQVVDTVFAYLGYDTKRAGILLILLVVGFIPVIYLSWKFELTSDGLRPDEEVDREQPQRRGWATRFDRAVTVLLVIAVSYFALDKFVLSRPNHELEKSIAVLPFDDMSATGDQQYFSDGIAEQLLDQLAKLDDLRVVSRSSAFALRDLQLTIPEIASRLNVAYILEGSVRKHEDKVRVTAQLIAAESDKHVWSGTYDGDISDVFSVQDEISQKVVGELKVKLLGQLPVQQVTDPETYDIYLQALSLLAARESGGPDKAAQLFVEVIEQDPQFAPAYGKLAMALFWGSSVESAQPIEEAVERALEMDPDNSDALAVRGRMRTIDGRSAEAEADLLNAIESGPNNPMAYRWLGTLIHKADPVRYLQYSTQAYELNRIDPTIRFHQGLALAMLGQYEEARAVAASLTGEAERNAGLNLAYALGWYDGNLAATAKTGYFWLRELEESEGVVRTFFLLDDIELAQEWMQYTVDVGGEDNFYAAIEESIVKYTLADLQAGDAAFERAIEIVDHDWPRMRIAEVAVRYNRKLDVAQKIFAGILERRDADPYTVDPYNWDDHLTYAQLLFLEGDTRRADDLFGQIESIIQAQLDAGVVNGQYGNNLYETMGGLLAMSGDHIRALEMLNRGAELGSLCVHCLRHFSQFDTLRSTPGFQKVLAIAAAHAAAERQKLQDEGMLLTPEEVLALQSFNFDPYNP